MPHSLPNEILRASVEIAADAFICTDSAQRITFFNRGAEKIFGYTAAEIVGRSLELLIPPRFHTSHDAHVQAFAGTDRTSRTMGERREVFGVRKDGTEFPAEASIAYVDTATSGRAFSVALRDVTERQEIERLNADLVRELRGAVSLRDETLSIVSHDLRNPVNAVKMLAAAILRTRYHGPLSPEVSSHATVMLQAAQQMDALIQDLLDVSRLESGRMPVTPHVIALRALVDAATEILRPAANEAGVHVATEIDAGLPNVDVDPDRIVQVLSNLVSNAIKYTSRGGKVLVSAVTDEDVVRVTVADTGVGIDESELPRVFDRFWQSRRTNRSGAGLGLAIARGIVRAHGGRIWIESKLGAGTSVHFTVARATRTEIHEPTS